MTEINTKDNPIIKVTDNANDGRTESFLALKTDIAISLERISDLLCSAFEGGSNHWMKIGDCHEPGTWVFSSHDKPDHHFDQDYPLNPGGYITIVEREDLTAYHKLDLAKIQKGLTIMSKAYNWHFRDFIQENDDAITGNVFLQCCLFGEVVYG